MIIASTGEVSFERGLSILPHHNFPSLAAECGNGRRARMSTRNLPIEGWRQHCLGILKSGYGEFEVEVVTGSENRVEGVFLSHNHSFYDSPSPGDGERRIFHDGIIASDLCGQKEFSWGHVFCRLENDRRRDWLVIIYNPFSTVPLKAREVYRQLFAHETPPSD